MVRRQNMLRCRACPEMLHCRANDPVSSQIYYAAQHSRSRHALIASDRIATLLQIFLLAQSYAAIAGACPDPGAEKPHAFLNWCVIQIGNKKGLTFTVLRVDGIRTGLAAFESI
jgi:hypothetical protein